MLNPDEMNLDISSPQAPAPDQPPVASSKPNTSSSAPQSSAPPSSKHNTKTKYSRGHEITTKTIKTPPFAYICLSLISSLSQPSSTNPTTSTLDALTARTYLTAALTQFLGLTGASMSIDILKIVGGGVNGDDVWVRVPAGDLAPVLAAVGGWVGRGAGGGGEKVSWRVRGSGFWLGGVMAGVEEGRVWRD